MPKHKAPGRVDFTIRMDTKLVDKIEAFGAREYPGANVARTRLIILLTERGLASEGANRRKQKGG